MLVIEPLIANSGFLTTTCLAKLINIFIENRTFIRPTESQRKA